MTRVLAVLLLTAAGLLAGCADEPGDVTCGEFSAMSTEQRRVVVRDVAEQNDTEDELADLGEGTRGVDLAAQGIAQRCADADDGETLDEVFAPSSPTGSPTSSPAG